MEAYMITINEARIQQNKEQKKSITILIISFIVLSAVCVWMYFVGEKEFQFALSFSIIAFALISYKVKVIEFFRKKEYEGVVTYFNVHNEKIKKTNSHQAGSMYDSYNVLIADMIVEEKNGKTREKTFRYNKEYANVKVGDKANVLRFVDKPIIEKNNSHN